MSEMVLNAFLIADKVIVEDNNKRGIIGIFDVFNLKDFPGVTPTWYIYASITNITGKHQFVFDLLFSKTSENIFKISGEFESKSKKVVIDLIIPVPPVKFLKGGDHMLNLIINDKLIASRYLLVQKKAT